MRHATLFVEIAGQTRSQVRRLPGLGIEEQGVTGEPLATLEND